MSACSIISVGTFSFSSSYFLHTGLWKSTATWASRLPAAETFIDIIRLSIDFLHDICYSWIGLIRWAGSIENLLKDSAGISVKKSVPNNENEAMRTVNGCNHFPFNPRSARRCVVAGLARVDEAERRETMTLTTKVEIFMVWICRALTLVPVAFESWIWSDEETIESVNVSVNDSAPICGMLTFRRVDVTDPDGGRWSILSSHRHHPYYSWLGRVVSMACRLCCISLAVSLRPTFD